MGSHQVDDDHDSEIVHRELDTDGDDPNIQIVEIVAEIEGRPPEALTPIWDCVDHVLEDIFSEPPSSEAQIQTTFTYEGYRITVEQNGTARFVPIS